MPSHRIFYRPLRHVASAIVLILLLILTGCTVVPAVVTPVSGEEIAQGNQPTSTPTSEPAPATPVTDVQRQVPLADLSAELASNLPIWDDSNRSGFDGVQVFPVTAGDRTVYVAHTYGIRPFDPLINHFVALYEYENQEWLERQRRELECPDYLGEDSVESVSIGDTTDASRDLWLAVYGGAGAHSGCFVLLHQQISDAALNAAEGLTLAAEGFNSSPDAGGIYDIDGADGAEVVLNNTDPYIFCYACGVRLFMAEILRWNGSELIPVTLARLGEETSSEARAANNRAIALAEASLFPPALSEIDRALSLAPDSSEVYWNAQWIRYHAQQRRELSEFSPYPLLNWVFYGDYAAAVEVMRSVEPEALFANPSALITGTPAEGWEDSVVQNLQDFSNAALDANPPDPASIHFVRAWASWLEGRSDRALLDLEQASALAPSNAYFSQALMVVQNRIGRAQETPTSQPPTPLPPTPTPLPPTPTPLPPTPTPLPTSTPTPIPAAVERIRFEPGAVVHPLTVELARSVTYLLDLAAGQRLYVYAPGTVPSLIGPNGVAIPSSPASDAVRFDLPLSGDYSLRFQGTGVANTLLHVPPLTEPADRPVPVTIQRVQFAAGGTSATVNDTYSRATPIGYVLGVSAGQQMEVTATQGDISFWVLDPAGRTLTAHRGRTARAGSYLIPRSGDYTVVVAGDGPGQLVLTVPPR